MMINTPRATSFGKLVGRDGDAITAIFGDLGSLPPGTNPFQYVLDQMDALTLTTAMRAPWFQGNMGAIGIVFVLAVFLHLLALVIPLLRGPKARSKHLWVVRTRYTGTFRQPYWVPNGRSLASAFSVITAIFFLAQIIMMLWAPAALNGAYYWLPMLPFFLVFCFVPFDAIYATGAAIRGEKTWTDRFKNPWLVNPLCWGVPIVVIVAESVFVARMWNRYPRLESALSDFRRALEDAAAGFDTKGIMAADVPRLTRTGKELQAQNDAFNVFQTQTVICETSVMIYASLLFSIALILLLKSVSGRLGLLPGFKSKSIERTTIIEQQLQTGRLSTQAETRTPEAVRAQRYIRRLYRLLVAYFTLLAGLVFFITACTVYIWANIAAVRADAHTSMVLFVALTWPIAIMLAILGWLSLSRVLELGLAKEDVTNDVAPATGRTPASPIRVGLFVFGPGDTLVNKDAGYASATSRPPSTPSGPPTLEHRVQRINVLVRRETSIEVAQQVEKEKPTEQESL